MAGLLPKDPKDFKKITGAKIIILASSWHQDVVEEMVLSATNQLLEVGAENKNIILYWVPGSHELPLYAKLLLEKHSDIDGIIAFGVVLRGGTTHNDSVINAVVTGFVSLGLKYSKPIINEVIGVDKIEDAKSRAIDKGIEAVFALTESLDFIKKINIRQGGGVGF